MGSDPHNEGGSRTPCVTRSHTPDAMADVAVLLVLGVETAVLGHRRCNPRSKAAREVVEPVDDLAYELGSAAVAQGHRTTSSTSSMADSPLSVVAWSITLPLVHEPYGWYSYLLALQRANIKRHPNNRTPSEKQMATAATTPPRIVAIAKCLAPKLG